MPHFHRNKAPYGGYKLREDICSFSAPDVCQALADILRAIVFVIPAAGRKDSGCSLLDT